LNAVQAYLLEREPGVGQHVVTGAAN
jgi:hypothetical protein